MSVLAQWLFPNKRTAQWIALALGALLVATQLVAQQPPLSHLATINGISTLTVEGKPFFILGAQCDIWRSTRQDAKTEAFFAGYEAMNATTVSVGVPWSRCEPTEDSYDFTFLDWFIAHAEAHHLKLVINLFNSNVCGKVQEGADGSAYPVYTPGYILSDPKRYQRMELPNAWKYDPGGPPMCPNDPNTRDREQRYVVKVMEHLKQTDVRRTVIMVQLDNEFYYNQWLKERPTAEKDIRCHCRYCEALWSAHTYKESQEFMFHSFAQYVRALTDAMSRIYPIPIYLNSPWWDPAVIPIFLDTCPNLALVGIDGIFNPAEPNVLSRSQVSRNIVFAAENPTENSETRYNLDALPYYTLIGHQGIGNLLWECGPPHTIVDDPMASKRYAEALFPLKAAMIPIAKARGTSRLAGWYTLRAFRPNAPTDAFGNLLPAEPESPVTQSTLFIREGATTRIVSSDVVTIQLCGISLQLTGAQSGVAVQLSDHELILALPHGHVVFPANVSVHAEHGQFIGEHWKSSGLVTVEPASDQKGAGMDVTLPDVIRVRLASN